MAGDSIGKLSLKIDGDATGLDREARRARESIERLGNDIARIATHGVAPEGGGGGDSGWGMFRSLSNISNVVEIFRELKATASEVWQEFKNITEELHKWTLESKNLNATVYDVQRLAEAAELSGVGMEAVTASFFKLQKNAAESMFGKMEAGDVMRNLGMSNVDLVTGSFAKNLLLAGDGIEKIENSAARTQAWMALAGKSGAQLRNAYLMLKEVGPETPLVAADEVARADKAFLAMKEAGHETETTTKRLVAWWSGAISSVSGAISHWMESYRTWTFGATDSVLADRAAAVKNKQEREAAIMLEQESTRRAKAEKEITESKEKALSIDKQYNDLLQKAKDTTIEMETGQNELWTKRNALVREMEETGGAGIFGGEEMIQQLDAQIMAANSAKEASDAAKEQAEAYKKARENVEATATAEQKLVKEMANAIVYEQLGWVTSQESFQMMKKAKESYLSGQKGADFAVPRVAIAGTSEATQSIVEYQSKLWDTGNRQEEILKSLLEAQEQAVTSLHAIQNGMSATSVVTMP